MESILKGLALISGELPTAALGTQRFSAAFGWGMILETGDQGPRQAPCTEPASPSACVSASLSLSHE